MVALLDGNPPPPCIMQHPDFASLCLCSYVGSDHIPKHLQISLVISPLMKTGMFVYNCICGM